MNGKTTNRLLTAFFLLVMGLMQAHANNAGVVAPPTNDDCANAIALTVNPNYLCGTVTSGTLLDATATSLASDSTTGACPGVTTKANDDVWFKFVASDNTHRVKLSNISGTPNNLYVNVYNGGTAGSCPTGAGDIPIYCSDPDVFNLTGLIIGDTYLIRVYSNSTASGATTTFDICVGSPPVAPSNDECANAELISSMPHNATYDATSATNNSGFVTASGCIDMNDGVWFKIIGDGGNIAITATPTAWDLGLAVYAGSCGAFTCIEDSNIGGSGNIEIINFISTVGTTYYINIGYPSGTLDESEGVFDFTVTSSTLSIDKISAKGFAYYPNPVDRVLKMSAKEPIQEVTLYSVLGKEIKRIKQNNVQAEVNLDHLPAGTYFVKALVTGSTGTFKIIKK